MLVRLTVQNYALIRELDMEPGAGLTIITGETGAGKSILLGALSLILGNRADTAALLNKVEKCVIEGVFDLAGKDMEIYFRENDLDYEDRTILRREINPAGKSRAFVNDTPVTLNILKDIGDRLVDIHSQHNNLLLSDSSFQLGVIDSLAGNGSLLHNYRAVYEEHRRLKREYDQLKERADANKADLEYFQFQYTQLEEAKLRDGEMEELEADRKELSHAEEILTALSAVTSMITEGEISAMNLLRDSLNTLRKVSGYINGGEELAARFESASIEIDDVASELAGMTGKIEADPAKLQLVNDRIDLIFTLLHKHRVATVSELVARRDELSEQIAAIETGDERLEQLGILMKKSSSELAEVAALLTASRLEVVPRLEERVGGLLRSLGIPNAKFVVRLNSAPSYTPSGADRGEFLFSANRQVPPESLSQVASGGELSRVMLSLKYLLSQSRNLPSIIFDEIDSGVSGEVAGMVGTMLSEMGENMQVINITHLPQIAALGSKHYFVYKNDTSDSTNTHIKLLSDGERLREVARLLSGSEITDAAVENAKMLFKRDRI
jgi:DNA repair protein RecN (Recombination protein N)